MPGDWATGLFVSAIGLAAVGAVSIVLSFFVGPETPPVRRAALTTGTAYLFVAAGGVVVGLLNGHRAHAMVVMGKLIIVSIGPAGVRLRCSPCRAR